jgi:hypothetical protein
MSSSRVIFIKNILPKRYFPNQKQMNYTINGKRVALSDDEFLCKGGEGKIYLKNGVAYKIYHDPSQMIPQAKIKELSEIDDPAIVKPLDLIFSGKQIVGFTMRALRGDTYPLVKLFTNTFRDNNGITNDHTTELVENIKNKTHYIHSKNCLIVDGNELNYMVGKDFVTPYFIDVNCWQTKSFPATAIMTSIKDQKTKGFSILTDWFSFGIVSFQLFIGIHPFKGTIDGYKKRDFAKRIIDCVSVLNPKVRIPSAARDFALIPSSYMDWYFKMFEKGERIAPPALPGAVGVVQVTVHLIQSTDNFEIREIRDFKEEILFHTVLFGNSITKSKDKIYVNKGYYKVSPNVEVLYTVENDKIEFHSTSSSISITPVNLKCTDFMIASNTLYLKNRGKLIEMDFRLFGNTLVPSSKKLWRIEKTSSQMFANVITQSILGDAFLVIPNPVKGHCYTIKIPKLDEYKIIDAKYENKVCVVIGHKDGKYDKLIFKFDDDHKKHTCRIVKDIDYMPINFVTLDNGVCIMINDDDSVEIFLNRIDKDDVKRIEDPDVDSTMRLFKDGINALFAKGSKLYSIKMK